MLTKKTDIHVKPTYSAIMLIVAFLPLLLTVSASSDCVAPWQKVNETSICLLLNSGIKNWNHAKFLCNFYEGQLLYIENESEQNALKRYFGGILRFRLSNRPSVWLDASNNLNLKNWIWTRNNETIQYSNWTKTSHDEKSKSKNCASFRLKDGQWRDSDCMSQEHFVCRKAYSFNSSDISVLENSSKKITEDVPSKIMNESMTHQTDTKEFNPVSNDSTNVDIEAIFVKLLSPFTNLSSTQTELTNEDKSIIITNILDNENNSSQLSKTIGFSQVPILQTHKRTKSVSTNNTLNLLRMRVPINTDTFKSFECPEGFGVYTITKSNCTKYKTCDYWDNQYAIMSVFKCIRSTFDFESLECVSPNEKVICDDEDQKFAS